MRHLARTYLCLTLATLIALASITHALARHQAHGATTMVICTGYGLVRITLDADGNPVEQSLPCPDCTLTQAALPLDTPHATCPVEHARRVFSAPETGATPGATRLWPHSRAPPALI